MRVFEIESNIRCGINVFLNDEQLNKFNRYLDLNEIKLGYNSVGVHNGFVLKKR